ncbi:MAG: hypothetical protein F6K31_29420 [Symploca sp. SIO2G7]|nr:hypothetical protein [Symploca sp. SIO2G7]
MTNEQLAEIRQRIQELEASDQDFAKKANTLLDEIIVNDQAIESLTRNLNEFIAESRRDREADRERIAFNEMRLDVFRERILMQDERFNTLQENIDRNIQQAEADRAVMSEILQYLRNQYPGNGKGG